MLSLAQACTSHKLELRSKPCVFLGYSLTQSAYYCLDPSNSKIYVSRHVKFVESQFPYASLPSKSPCPPSSPITTWIPPPIRVESPNPQPPLTLPYEVVIPQHLPCEASTSSVVPIKSSNPPPNAQTDATHLPSSPTPTQSITNPSSPQTEPTNLVLVPTHSMTTRAKNHIHNPSRN